MLDNHFYRRRGSNARKVEREQPKAQTDVIAKFYEDAIAYLDRQLDAGIPVEEQHA